MGTGEAMIIGRIVDDEAELAAWVFGRRVELTASVGRVKCCPQRCLRNQEANGQERRSNWVMSGRDSGRCQPCHFNPYFIFFSSIISTTPYIASLCLPLTLPPIVPAVVTFMLIPSRVIRRPPSRSTANYSTVEIQNLHMHD